MKLLCLVGEDTEQGAVIILWSYQIVKENSGSHSGIQ